MTVDSLWRRLLVHGLAVVVVAAVIGWLAGVHPVAAAIGAALLVVGAGLALAKQEAWPVAAAVKVIQSEEPVERRADLLGHLPLSLVYLDNSGLIVWHNEEFARLIGRDGESLRGKIRSYLPELHFRKQSGFRELLSSRLIIGERRLKVSLRVGPQKDRRLLCIDDVTDFEQRTAREEGPVMGICTIDNFVDTLAPLDEGQKTAVLADVDKVLGEWALSVEGYLRKLTEDRYLLLLSGAGLRLCQVQNFAILDRIRAIRQENKLPITLSIGLGVGEESMVDLGRMARTALELALGRGGDQVVVKSAERVLFYGGNTEALEKRTRVRARVVAKTLKALVGAASNVLIMGHENADLDTAGSALGLARAVMRLGKPVRIFLDQRGGGLDRLLPHVRQDAELAGAMIAGPEALEAADQGTLLIVVDTHKPSMLPERRLLAKVGKIVIIDHHRRGEEFIEPHELVYLESYASSTCELVAEILQYLDEEVELGRVAASALLAGITVDTKHFVFMTGARTFEAASYLRRSGADPQLVQDILRDPLDTVVRRAAIVKNAELLYGRIALGMQREFLPRGPVIAAQAADSLLEVEGVKASFVLRALSPGTAISARSQGEINVHAIMERLGGGGHLTIAGAQLPDVEPDTARMRLIAAIDAYLADGGTERRE
ncbi:DHH family phosphoesterase [Heliophilum fasciatum]|uniref:Cyclic-di-AMP phosphodiesterase n=1 Tax=Heliophilum fasciatum TaxID=35700 RepID=A0A4R2RNH5_9FIRM|nr:DHH family phosphoesterase [Heliophilum fasciatum]MCW2278232.1 c-di-AMP phosphodiesterase-like protein [Heliophilum fasciatum]TCP63857.1 c-di-AMP phosphodiesterase-like protein [Heliophilum fasciatum]